MNTSWSPGRETCFRPASSAGFYDGYRAHQNFPEDPDFERPRAISEMGSSRGMNASNVANVSTISPRQKLRIYLGAKRLSMPAVKPTSLKLDQISTDLIGQSSFEAYSPSSDLSFVSNASTEKNFDGPRDFLISTRKARREAESDCQVRKSD